MSPLLLSRSEIQDERWDELIAKSNQSVVYGFSWYLDIVCDDWEAIIWPSPTDYRVVMPLPVKRKWGIKIVQQPLFCQFLGLFSADNIPAELVFQFLEKLNSSFSYISAYQFHPDNSSALVNSFPKIPAFQLTTKHSHWLSLVSPFDKIQSEYSLDRKKNLKNSFLENWEIVESTDLDPLIGLFKDNHAGNIPGGVGVRAYEILKSIFQNLSLRNAVKLLYAVKNEQIHAGVFIAESETRRIYLFNAADQMGRKGNARTLLLNEYFRINAGRNLVFDFESPELSSIASFYSSFGAEKITYLSIRKNGLPFPINKIQDWRVRRSLKTTEVQSGDF